MAKLTIEYFKLNYSIDDQYIIDGPITDKEVLQDFWIKIIKKAKDCIENIDSNYFKIDNSDNFIEFIEAENDYLFGILGKSDEITEDLLKRIRNNENINTENLFLEKYNYFYLRREDYSVNVIGNSQSPGFRRPFTSFLSTLDCNRIKNISIIPKLDNNISEKINKMTNILEINTTFNQDSIIGNRLLSLKDTFNLSNNNLIKASIQINLKNQSMPKELEELLLDEDRIKSDFDKFKIIGNGPEGEEVVELVGRLLTKSIEIYMQDEDIIKDKLDKIKKALKESFSI